MSEKGLRYKDKKTDRMIDGLLIRLLNNDIGSLWDGVFVLEGKTIDLKDGRLDDLLGSDSDGSIAKACLIGYWMTNIMEN